ncbi:fructosamine kinase family protein [Gryllotalpicola daejeonensis]|uniref:Fructosamine kinase family protein n=1 Tax=Gryllotalpicola daejeonensis TaxID=993087 RepID=A0ABP7ZMF1_9MICO
MDTLVKENPDAPEGFFESEAAGLRWLAEATEGGGARVVAVIDVSPAHIELERIHAARPTPEMARAFGAALARTHDAGADAFGAPPRGWQGPGFIGKRRQLYATETRWGLFYARERVLPFLEIAEQAGSVTATEARSIRAACELVARGEFDDDQPPARIHGDLWNGNLLWDEAGGVLIDPAAHGGHRETDLAMLALFGAPHLGDIVAGYESVHPLVEGWRERIPVHQLHPLAVHAAGYGRGYGVELADAARRTLALRGR